MISLDDGLVFQAELLVVDLLPAPLNQPGLEGGRHAPFQLRRQRPVLLRLKGADLFFPLADQPHGHRLHAAGAQSAPHLDPQQRTDLVTDQAVQNAPRHLGVEFVAVELLRVGDGL